MARSIASSARAEKRFFQNIIAKVADTQQLRKELQEVKKLARERAKAITLRIPQLKDCKNHFDKKKEKGKGTMVFICEGQSAGLLADTKLSRAAHVETTGLTEGLKETVEKDLRLALFAADDVVPHPGDKFRKFSRLGMARLYMNKVGAAIPGFAIAGPLT